MVQSLQEPAKASPLMPPRSQTTFPYPPNETLGMVIRPRPLVAGDVVALVCPARWVETEVVVRAERWLRFWGLTPLRGATTAFRTGPYAGTTQQRIDDLNAQFRNTNVRAILALRGGYGCLELIDFLDWRAFAQNPSWLVGYSDVTILLTAALRHGVAAMHASMPIEWPETPNNPVYSKGEDGQEKADDPELAAMDLLRRALIQPQLGYSTSKLTPLTSQPKSPLSLTGGPMVGGNLSSLYSLLGSGTLPSFAGCFVFLEDIDEYRYHIRRMLASLRRSGVMDGARLLMQGSFTQIHQSPFEGQSSEKTTLMEAFPFHSAEIEGFFGEDGHFAQHFLQTAVMGVPAGHGLAGVVTKETHEGSEIKRGHAPLILGVPTEIGFAMHQAPIARAPQTPDQKQAMEVSYLWFG